MQFFCYEGVLKCLDVRVMSVDAGAKCDEAYRKLRCRRAGFLEIVLKQGTFMVLVFTLLSALHLNQWCFSRATHKTGDHREPHDSVKRNFFSKNNADSDQDARLRFNLECDSRPAAEIRRALF